MPQKELQKPKIAIVTLIQEGVAKIGGEHAMLFPYVEQAIKAAESIKDEITVIPYVISPKPKVLEILPRVDELKEQMKKTNNGRFILVSNGGDEPYGDPWNWERYGYEANLETIKLVKEDHIDGLIILAHGFASIPVVFNLVPSMEGGQLGTIPTSCYFIAHSTFDEHKDNRPQRKILEQAIQNHAKIIAISPYMSNHLESINIVHKKEHTIPLYNALPENGWFSTKISEDETLEMILSRNTTINQGPFYGQQLPIQEILAGKKELVLYFGRAQKYVKGTDAIIACAKNDPKRHYFLICSGSEDELKWHKNLIKGLNNITLDWEHNSKIVLGTVQLTENNDKARIIALFLSRREPMGLVSRELVLMQTNGSVLPIVSDQCGFEDIWQKEFSYIVANPCFCEEDQQKKEANSKMQSNSDLFIHDSCIQDTMETLDKLSKLSIEELRNRVKSYAEAVKKHYSQDRYWAFYLQAINKVLPKESKLIKEIIEKNKLIIIDNL